MIIFAAKCLTRRPPDSSQRLPPTQPHSSTLYNLFLRLKTLSILYH